HAPRCHGSYPGEAPDHIAALPTLLITVSILPRLHPGRSYPKYKPWNERVDNFVVPRVGLAFLGDGLCQFGVHVGPWRNGRGILPGAREGHHRGKTQAKRSAMQRK